MQVNKSALLINANVKESSHLHHHCVNDAAPHVDELKPHFLFLSLGKFFHGITTQQYSHRSKYPSYSDL